MNKEQIKTELRRSAREEWPPLNCQMDAYFAAISYRDAKTERLTLLSYDDCRTFFLLVAEAL